METRPISLPALLNLTNTQNGTRNNGLQTFVLPPDLSSLNFSDSGRLWNISLVPAIEHSVAPGFDIVVPQSSVPHDPQQQTKKEANSEPTPSSNENIHGKDQGSPAIQTPAVKTPTPPETIPKQGDAHETPDLPFRPEEPVQTNLPMESPKSTPIAEQPPAESSPKQPTTVVKILVPDTASTAEPKVLIPGSTTTIDSTPVVLLPGGGLLVGGIPVSLTPGSAVTIGTQVLSPVVQSPSVPVATPHAVIPIDTPKITAHLTAIGPVTDIVVVGTNTLFPGGRPLTTAGQTISAASGGVIVVQDGTTESTLTLTSPPATLQPTPEAIFTVGSETLTAHLAATTGDNISRALVIGDTTLFPGGPAITSNGQTISAAPGDLVVIDNGSSKTSVAVTAASPTGTDNSPQAVITLGPDALTAYLVTGGSDIAGAVVIGSETLFPGGPAMTMAGETISVASGGLMVVQDGGSNTTITIPTATTTVGDLSSGFVTVQQTDSRTDAGASPTSMSTSTKKTSLAARIAPSGFLWTYITFALGIMSWI